MLTIPDNRQYHQGGYSSSKSQNCGNMFGSQLPLSRIRNIGVRLPCLGLLQMFISSHCWMPQVAHTLGYIRQVKDRISIFLFLLTHHCHTRVCCVLVNLVICLAQMITVPLCLVGWCWSVGWGISLVNIASWYQGLVRNF